MPRRYPEMVPFGGLAQQVVSDTQDDDVFEQPDDSGTELTEIVPVGTPPMLPFESLGGNRLVRMVGRGGMGEVWLGHDSKLDRSVAIKLMRRELADNPEFVARFMREARAVAKLNHSNIIQIYQFGEEHDVLFFVMEWVDGQPLSRSLKPGAGMPLEEALKAAQETIAGLGYAQEMGIVHRDIKPDNLMLDSRGRVKIADFGLAKIVAADQDHGMTTTGALMGSPSFMSPEQARGEVADHRSDIYSLGITLYQAVTGSLPHTDKTAYNVLRKHVEEPLPEPYGLKQLLNGQLLRVLKKMTAKEPAERYQDYESLGQDIAALQSELKSLHSTATQFADLAAEYKARAYAAQENVVKVKPFGLAAPTPWIVLIGIVIGAAGLWKVHVATRVKTTLPALVGPETRSASVTPVPTVTTATPDAAPAANDAEEQSGMRPRRKLEAMRGRRPLMALVSQFPDFAKAYEAYDFDTMLSMMERATQKNPGAAEIRAELEAMIAHARTLQGLKSGIIRGATNRGNSEITIPHEGQMLTLIAPSVDGFRFADPSGKELPVTWEDLLPLQVSGLARQLTEQFVLKEEAFAAFYPMNRNAPPPRQPATRRAKTAER